MFKAIVVSALGSAGIILMSQPVRAASPEYCHHYADQAVWQYHKSKEIPDCYQGDNAVWTANWAHHYDWCLGASWEQARGGDDMRGHRLHECNMRAFGHP